MGPGMLDDRLRQVFADVLGVDVSETDSRDMVESWDSLNHLHLVIALEAEYNVSFDGNEIWNLHTVGAIQARLNQLTA